MNKRLISITVLIMFVLFVGIQMRQQLASQSTFSNAVIRYGATGKDVVELQGRLRFLGFYKSSVDGDYGYNTLKAVKWFQSEFGLKADGVVGSKTKLKLWEASKNWRPTATDVPGGSENTVKANYTSPAKIMGLSENDLKLMANAVYGEARGEPYVGQVAVAAVILNRIKSASFPNTVSGVIFQPGAFTAVADGQIWLTPNATAKKAVRDALNGWDPSGGCIYYFNPVTATSKWIWSRPQVKTIGKHIFCM